MSGEDSTTTRARGTLDLRPRLAAALALMALALGSGHLIEAHHARKALEHDRVVGALGLVVDTMAEQLINLDGIVTALGPYIAADDRNALRRGLPDLDRALGELRRSHAEGVMAPRSQRMMDNAYVAPLAAMERLADHLHAVAASDGLWGENARFHVETVHAATVAVLPLIRQLQRFEADRLERTGVRMGLLRGGAWAVALTVLIGIWLGIFRPLERRVFDDRAALQDGLRRAEAASDAKSRFVATMSHEIRTPLVGVLGAAELMRTGPLEREQAELADIIHSSGRSLLGVLDDVLDFARIESGHLAIAAEAMDPCDVVEETARLFSAQARTKGVALRHELPRPRHRPVLGDAPHIRQALCNLVGNAVKFTDSGSVTIRLRAEADGAAGTALTFEVEDTGPGLSEEELARVFEAFEQADGSTSRRHGGTGLGLAISMRLAEAMGGRLSATSEPGRGSCFRLSLTLPAAGGDAAARAREVPAEAGPGPSPGGAAGAGPLVLVADDNRTNRLVLGRMLERAGCRVAAAEDGVEAVEGWRRDGPDLILMDVSMPVMDGLVATGIIRDAEREGSLGRTPIVAVSAHVGEAHRARCLAAGMDEVLGKPFSQAGLASALSMVEAGRGRAVA
jgi:signal transduction histidine kinase/ActR/RegA family two-component response regulator